MFEVTDQCNLTTIDSIHVTLFVDPVIQLGNLIGDCPPFQNAYTILVNPAELAGDLYWSTNFGQIDSSNFQNLYVTYLDAGAGTLDVSFTSANGCQVDTSFTSVTVYGLPTAQFTVNPNAPTIYDANVQLVNTSLNYSTSEWFILGDTLTTTDANINFDYSTYG